MRNGDSDIKQFFAEVEADNVIRGNMTYLVVHDGERLRPASIALGFKTLLQILVLYGEKPIQLGIKYLDVDDDWDEFPLINSTRIRMMSVSFMSLQRFVTILN